MTIYRNALKAHPFEFAGLGLAPFKFVSMAEKWFNPTSGSLAYDSRQSKPGSSCDYCGTAIAREFHCISSDGKMFKVGCDCIEKVGDHKLLAAAKSADKAAKRAVNNEKRKIVQAARQAEWDKPKLALIEAGKMPFGKYWGQEFDCVDDNYVKWLFLAAPVGAVNIALQSKLKSRHDAILAAEQAAKVTTKHVGAVGDKLKGLEVEIIFGKVMSPYCYGAISSILFVMKDKVGNKYSTFYSGNEIMGAGDVITINATIKAHKEYNGEKQTVLTRIRKVK